MHELARKCSFSKLMSSSQQLFPRILRLLPTDLEPARRHGAPAARAENPWLATGGAHRQARRRLSGPVWVCVRVSVCVWVGVGVGVWVYLCVCPRERERERGSVCVCMHIIRDGQTERDRVTETETERACVCVCISSSPHPVRRAVNK